MPCHSFADLLLVFRGLSAEAVAAEGAVVTNGIAGLLLVESARVVSRAGVSDSKEIKETKHARTHSHGHAHTHSEHEHGHGHAHEHAQDEKFDTLLHRKLLVLRPVRSGSVRMQLTRVLLLGSAWLLSRSRVAPRSATSPKPTSMVRSFVPR